MLANTACAKMLDVISKIYFIFEGNSGNWDELYKNSVWTPTAFKLTLLDVIKVEKYEKINCGKWEIKNGH